MTRQVMDEPFFILKTHQCTVANSVDRVADTDYFAREPATDHWPCVGCGEPRSPQQKSASGITENDTSLQRQSNVRAIEKQVILD